LKWPEVFSNWAWFNNKGLQQIGTIECGIRKDNCWIEANLLRTKGTTRSSQHWVGEPNLYFASSSSRLEGSIWNVKGAIK
jgi:hypothetical protein